MNILVWLELDFLIAESDTSNTWKRPENIWNISKFRGVERSITFIVCLFH